MDSPRVATFVSGNFRGSITNSRASADGGRQSTSFPCRRVNARDNVDGRLVLQTRATSGGQGGRQTSYRPRFGQLKGSKGRGQSTARSASRNGARGGEGRVQVVRTFRQVARCLFYVARHRLATSGHRAISRLWLRLKAYRRVRSQAISTNSANARVVAGLRLHRYLAIRFKLNCRGST